MVTDLFPLNKLSFTSDYLLKNLNLFDGHHFQQQDHVKASTIIMGQAAWLKKLFGLQYHITLNGIFSTKNCSLKEQNLVLSNYLVHRNNSDEEKRHFELKKEYRNVLQYQ